MKKVRITNRIYEAGALAVVRTDSFERACEIADGVIKGGVPVMEMSFTLNSAGTIIQQLKAKYGDQLIVGAGTVLDAETARYAILHDADFIIAPTYDEEVAKMCNRYQIPYAPGCTSYTEAMAGLTMGAAFIKAFPISDFYGSKMPKIFKTVIPAMPIMASGGLNLDNLQDWLESGVDVCGFGGLLTKGTSDEIAANAASIRQQIDSYRSK